MYADLFSIISKESKIKLCKSMRWEDIELLQCPKSLMEEICIVHQASNTGSTQNDKLFSRRLYNRLRQLDIEPLASFHKRTQECLETQRSIGQANVPENELAIDFLYNILQREYSGLNEKLVYAEEERKRAHAAATAAATLANPLTVPIPFITGYPITFLDAFQRANLYQVTNATLQGDKHQKTQQIAFATTSSDQSQKAKPTRIADAVWAKMSMEDVLLAIKR